MRLTRGAWFLLGFGLTLAVIYAGACVWTLLEEQDNGDHLTKIERIVVGLHQAQKAPARGGDALQPAKAGQQPSPATAPAHEHGGKQSHEQQPKGNRSPKANEVPESPPATTTGKPAGDEAPGSTPPPADDVGSESGNGLIEVPGISVGEPPCPVQALGTRVCTE